jgi:RHS repeat-associated protein
LGGQVIAELDYFSASGQWGWQRGYVYGGAGLLAVQHAGVYYVHEDPVTKGKRMTSTSGAVQSETELDPYGAEVGAFESNAAFQPRKFTSYERDANSSDEAMLRRYNRWHSRFDQPDPYNGSYNLTDPQSFNRYSYTQNDPVNFTDPSGLEFYDGPDFIGLLRLMMGRWELNLAVVESVDSQNTQQAQQPTKKLCKFTDTRITHYDSPKGNTAIRGASPVEGRTAAADPTFFGFPYPRGGKSKEERAANLRTRTETQAALKAADIIFSIPGLGLRHFEDVGGAVDDNRIDIYVDKNASTAATKYNRQFGDLVSGIIAFIPSGMSCPKGSQEISPGEAGF